MRVKAGTQARQVPHGLLSVAGVLGDAGTAMSVRQPTYHLLQASSPDVQSCGYRHGARLWRGSQGDLVCDPPTPLEPALLRR
jgi:hypothetical protein